METITKYSPMLLFSLFFLFSGCSQYSQKTEHVISSNNYEKDKKQIAACFISIVEHYRLHPFKYGLKYPESDLYYTEHPDQRDYSNLFEPYSVYYKNDNEGYLPIETNSWDNIQVKTDSILYNSDELICFAFLAIKINTAKEIETRKLGREYDAVAIIGLRNSIDESFNIYPITEYKAVGYSSYDKALNTLKYFYFNKLGNQKDFRKSPFKVNVGSKGFWDKSLYFQKFSGLYYFQTHMPAGDSKRYIKHEIINCKAQ